MSVRARLLVGIGAALVLAIASCDGGPSGPARADVVGLWLPSALVLTLPGDSIDLMASRSFHFRMSLESDGRILGRLYLPGGLEDGGTLDADMRGSWSLQGDRVLLEQSWDTFVRDLDLRWVSHDTLSGRAVAGDSTYTTVLVRHHPPGATQ